MQSNSFSNSKLKLNQHIVLYAKAIFNSRIQQKLCQNVDSTLSSDSWDLTRGIYIEKNWNQIFLNMLQTFARQIWFCFNKRSIILKQIEHVKFSELCLVSFTENNIQNIQELSMLNLQKLKHLYLRGNKISRIQCLKKLWTPQLTHIDLTLNCIKKMDLSLLKVNQQQFQNFYFQSTFEQPTLNESLACMAKIQTKIVQTFTVNSFTRIHQKKINKMLQKKFPNAWINVCQK